MPPSDAIPNAILNTKIVLGFKGICKKPIIAAVITRGIMLGTNEIITIRNDENKENITKAISNAANSTLSLRFFIK
jgi:dTDP-glucose pyrophosphorylase